MKLEPNPFAKKVFAMILKIPKGNVATYGQIAALAGKPHGARGVGWLLHSSSTTRGLPWHRVLNAAGKISFEARSTNYKLQRSRLEREGVRFTASGGVQLTRYQWKKKARVTANRGQPTMFA